MAGITITYVLGENGVFNQALNAKMQTEIAYWREKLEMAKSSVIIEGIGTFNIETYFQNIQNQGIINNKDTDIVNNNDGTYDIITKEGYVFLITLIPNLESPTDAEIKYIGQVGKIPPIIKKLEANITNTKISAKAIISRLEDGNVEYYYKTSAEHDYKNMTLMNIEDGAYVNLTPIEGTTYIIKVVAKNTGGESERTVEITVGVKAKSITLNKVLETMEVNETVKLIATVLPENAESKEIEWSSSNTDVAVVDQEGNVIAKALGSTDIKVKSLAVDNVEAICKITVKKPVESITLNREKANVDIDGTISLTATINPDDATNKEVTWKSSDNTIATVDSKGVVTGKAYGTATITAISSDDITKTASCTVNVTDESDWQEIAKVAKMVAEDSWITSRTSRIIKNGMTINVGDVFKVKYKGITKNVRVIGFNHDILSNPVAAYGSDTNATTAGITFEFTDFLETSTRAMNESYNIEGWQATSIRRYLEGVEGIGQISGSCRSNIKQVRKRHIVVENATLKAKSSDSKLWLLSCSEIYTDAAGSGYQHGYAVAEEGIQYNFYYRLKPSPNYSEPGIIKRFPSSGDAQPWWLRSVEGRDFVNFCYIDKSGKCQYGQWSDRMLVSPGFCI